MDWPSVDVYLGQSFILVCFISTVFRQYAAIVFITNNRFETVKKKLLYLTFDDYVYCANKMIQNWSYSSKGEYELTCTLFTATTKESFYVQ